MDIIELPPLTGTEKQVAWATELRAGFLASFDGHLYSFTTDIVSRAQAGAMGAQIESAMPNFKSIADNAERGAARAAMRSAVSARLYAVALEFACEMTEASDWIDARHRHNFGFDDDCAERIGAAIITAYGVAG